LIWGTGFGLAVFAPGLLLEGCVDLSGSEVLPKYVPNATPIMIATASIVSKSEDSDLFGLAFFLEAMVENHLNQ
jgi:hypothetical protein